MPKVTASTVLPATAEQAFEFLADYRNVRIIQPHFTSVACVSEQERGSGAMVELQGRFHGVPIKTTQRIITFTPPHRLVSVTEGSLLSRTTWELEQLSENPPSTKATITLEYSLKNLMGGLFMGMGSALWPLFNREIQGMTDE